MAQVKHLELLTPKTSQVAIPRVIIIMFDIIYGVSRRSKVSEIMQNH